MTTKEPPLTVEDLLDNLPSEEEKTSLTDLKDEGKNTPSTDVEVMNELRRQLAEAQKAIADLKELSSTSATSEKTDAQKSQEHAQARAANDQFEKAAPTFETEESDDSIVVHLLEDGLTFADRVWYAGQTVRFNKQGRAYQDTLDRYGNSWLNDLSPSAQRKRFGKVFFGEGPYDGPAFDDEVSRMDANRGTAAPVVSV